jgi:DNA recombination protein RmuC
LFCREDKQVENLKEISQLGSHLYKKIGLFVEKLRDVQSNLDNSSEALKTALNHLNRGQSSILSDAKELNRLGGFSQKDLPDINE